MQTAKRQSRVTIFVRTSFHALKRSSSPLPYSEHIRSRLTKVGPSAHCRMTLMSRLALFPLSLLTLIGSAQVLPAPEAALPVGVPLRIRITHTAHLHIGTPVTGVLTEPVYLYDHLVLPQNSTVLGVVTGYARIDRKLRTQALLNGDVTPLHDPVVDFNRLQLPGSSQQISISSRGVIRNTQLVRFTARKNRPIYVQQAEDMARAQIKSVHDTFFTPGRTDCALRLVLLARKNHVSPATHVWAGTGFIANLSASLDLPSSQPAAAALASSRLAQLHHPSPRASIRRSTLQLPSPATPSPPPSRDLSSTATTTSSSLKAPRSKASLHAPAPRVGLVVTANSASASAVSPMKSAPPASTETSPEPRAPRPKI